MKIKKKSLIIIPVFNEEESFESLIPYLNHYRRSEFIFINDGSTDGTKEVISKYPFDCMDIEENRGKGNAISIGTKFAMEHGKKWIITMDGDLQHPPELIPHFDDDGKCEIKLGWRKNKDTMPLFRKLSNIITSLLLSIRSNVLIRDSQCGYRGFPTETYLKCNNREPGFHMESEFLIKASILGVPINHIEIPTIYNESKSSMNYVPDLMKFISLWIKSFLWI